MELKYLYDLSMPLRQRVDVIAKEVYGAAGVIGCGCPSQGKAFESDPKYDYSLP
jgi:formate--tetrahydrofolate ligase